MPLIFPKPPDLARLRNINSLLTEYRTRGHSQALLDSVRIAMEDVEFRASYVAAHPGKKLKTNEDLIDVCWNYFYFFLYRRDYVSAALILWDRQVFTPEPHCVQLIWEAISDERMISVIGGGGQGKTYSPSAWMLLDWVLDPEWTRVQISSNTEDHLKKNLYADIVRLHSESALKLPGTADAESISLDKKKGMGIFLLTIPGGQQSKGKIKGVHTKPRPDHPLFGTRSRVRAIIDEAQEVAQNIFAEIPNRFSTAIEGDVEHIKFIVCANPKDPYSPFGQICKPPAGWDFIQMAMETWRSEKGWWIVSLNAMVHENVIARRIVYPGFVTYEGVQNWLTACSGDPEHPDMYTFVYGKFPQQGTARAINSLKDLQRSEREWIFDGPTTNFGFADYAFTGDLPTFGVARSGRAVAWNDYSGKRFELKKPAVKIQIDVVGIMDRGDTQDLTDGVLSRAKNLTLKPHHFGDDRTGVGQGPHDLVRRQWKQKVGVFDLDEVPEDVEGFDTSGTASETWAPTYGIHFGQEATSVKVAEEDTLLPVDAYDGIRSEVWYAFARLLEYDVIGIGKNIDPKAFQELASRRGGRPVGKGRKLAVESKETYRARTGSPSPDRADAITGVVHVARMCTPNLIPKARDTEDEPEPPPQNGRSLEIDSWGTADIAGFDGAPAFTQKD
jgi:hypothetical protein